MSADVLLRALNRIVANDIKNKRTEGFAYIQSRQVHCGSEHAYRLPNGYATRDIEKHVDALVGAVGAPVELIDRAGAVIVRVVEKDFPRQLPFRESDLKNDALLIGYDRLMRPVYQRYMHMLVGGASRAGKTVWLRFGLYQMARAGAIVKVADLKRYSFFPFENLPGFQIAKSLEETADMLQEAMLEIERREHLVEKYRDRNILKSQPLYIVVIDEAAQIAPKTYTSKHMKGIAAFCDEAVSRIAQKGGESRVILVYCTQRPDASIINGQVKSNVESALAFRTYTDYDSRIILNREGAERISVTTPGRCIFRSDTFYNLQAPFVSESDADWEKLLKPLKTEVIERGNSRRTQTRPASIEGSFTSAVRDSHPAKPAKQQFGSLQEGIRYPAAVGAEEVSRVGVSPQRKAMAAHSTGAQTDGSYSDEID